MRILRKVDFSSALIRKRSMTQCFQGIGFREKQTAFDLQAAVRDCINDAKMDSSV